MAQQSCAQPLRRRRDARRISLALTAMGLFGSGAHASIVITPTQQTRTIFASGTAPALQPNCGVADHQESQNAAPGAGFFEASVAAVAVSGCADGEGSASQSSNTLVSSLVAAGSTAGWAQGVAANGKGKSTYDVSFVTSAAGPFVLEGQLAVFTPTLSLSSSSAVARLFAGDGSTISVTLLGSFGEGNKSMPVAWAGNLPAGSYRLLVECESTGVDFANATANFNVRLVACDPWCAPPNNLCANAIDVGEGTHAFSNINATDSGDYPACTFALDSKIRSDVWYRVTADCTGNMTVATCGGTALDTKIGVYQGGTCPPNPGSLVLLGCNDDACAFQSSVTIPVVAGSQYLVRIGGYHGQQGTGLFTISYACAVPNDICSGSLPIALGTTAYSTLAATSGEPSVPGCGAGLPAIGADIWFDFVSPCTGTIQVSTCNSVNYDSKLAVYDGCPMEGEAPLACNDDSPGCNLGSVLTFQAVGGAAYRVRVGGYVPFNNIPSKGTGTINLTCLGLLGDLNGDGHVDGADLGILLGSWDLPGIGDLNGDGVTDGADLGILLSNWTG